MKDEAEVPEGVEVKVEANKIKVSGPLGALERTFPARKITIKKQDNKIKLTPNKENALTRAIVGTFASHIENMIKGVQEKFTYKLKICSIHFPMTVKVEGKELKISNFLGGRKPRVIKIPPEIEAKVSGDMVEVSSINKELAGSFSAKIEQKSRAKSKDRRVFQDGVYMIEKAGEKI